MEIELECAEPCVTETIGKHVQFMDEVQVIGYSSGDGEGQWPVKDGHPLFVSQFKLCPKVSVVAGVNTQDRSLDGLISQRAHAMQAMRDATARVQSVGGVRLTREVAAEVAALVDRPFTFEGSTCPSYPEVNRCNLDELLPDKDIAGQHTFLLPPHQLYQSYIEHANKCYLRAPVTTSACVLVPRWNRGNFCAKSLKGWTLLKTYPKRAKVFEHEVNGRWRAKAGVPYLLDVWYRAPTAGIDVLGKPSGPTFVCSGYAASRPMRVGIGTAKEERVELEKVGLGSVLLDSGATDCFVNTKWLKLAGYDLSQLKPCVKTVHLADSSEVKVEGMMTLPIKLGQFRDNVKVMALDIGSYDLILGDNWLRATNAVMDYGSHTCTLKAGSKRITLRPRAVTQSSSPTKPNVAVISALQAKRLVPKAAEIGVLMLSRIPDTGEVSLNSVSSQEELQSSVQDPELRKLIGEHIDLFGSIPPNSARDRGLGPTINLEPGAAPPWRPVYKLTLEERKALTQQIQEMLERGWIEPSVSPYGAPVIFVRKKDGSLRLVIDYRALNKVTVRNRYPLPRIDDLIDIIGKAKYFTSLDLTSGYHQVKIAEEDVEKTAFRTPDGHFQWRVLSMGLTNAPSVFQMVMNRVFGALIGKSVVVYLDDILIFSKTQEEHLEHIRQVFEILKKEQLYCKLAKCEFMKEKVAYLGHIINEHGVQPDPSKVQVVKDWPRPKSVHELRSFLGLCNYFRRYIKSYARKTYPLTELLKKGVWEKGGDPWDETHDLAFQVVKEALTTAPVLTHYDMSKPVELICDASKVALGGILMQDGRPIAYESRKFTPAETRYSTGDRELLAVIHCLKVWRCYLHGQPFTLVTDHKPNTYLRSLENWSDRQARWNEKLEQFPYVWEYRKGEDNIADPLSRIAVLIRTANRMVTNFEMLDRHAWKWRVRDPSTEDPSDIAMEPRLAPITRQMVSEVQEEAGPNEVQGQDVNPSRPLPAEQSMEAEQKRFERKVTKLLSNRAIAKSYDSQEWSNEVKRHPTKYEKHANGLWYMGNKIVIPPGQAHADLRKAIIVEHHNTPFAGHPGFDRLKASITRSFTWSGLHTEVLAFCRDCVQCARNKSGRRRRAGHIYPHDIPEYPWETISMDFITGLPQTLGGHDTIAVFVDKLTKMVHLHPCSNKGLTADQLVDVFMTEIFRHHGVPKKIISDRDPKITAAFWRTVIERLGSRCNISTAFHPETDGQTEVFNKVIEEVLRNFVSPTQTNWHELLPACEFALNDHVHSGTQDTPFYLNYGRHPVRPIDMVVSTLGGEGATESPSSSEYDPRLLKEDASRQRAQQRVEALDKALKRAKTCLRAAINRMVERENAKRDDVVYSVGDKVWLSSRNFMWKSGARKLCPKWLGPFEVTEVMGPLTYRLELPPEWRLHDVFHVSILKPFKQEATYRAPIPVKVVDGEPHWEVEEIVQHRKNSNKTTSFLIHWKGFGREWQSWQPESNISRGALTAYWKRVHKNPDIGKVREPSYDENALVT